jgi:hypothetical protein
MSKPDFGENARKLARQYIDAKEANDWTMLPDGFGNVSPLEMLKGLLMEYNTTCREYSEELAEERSNRLDLDNLLYQRDEEIEKLDVQILGGRVAAFTDAADELERKDATRYADRIKYLRNLALAEVSK